MPIRVALVGFGNAARFIHEPLLRANSNFQIVQVSARSESSQDAALKSYPEARVAASLDECRWNDVDLAIVTLPHHLHSDAVRVLAQSGVRYVVVEKPLTDSFLEAQKLIEFAASHGCQLSVFHNRRWDRDFLTVSTFLENGGGTPIRFFSRLGGWAPNPGLTWRDKSTDGALDGSLVDIGSHLVDQAIQLFGRVKSVSADLRKVRPGTEVEDDCFVILDHFNGVQSVLQFGLLESQPEPRFELKLAEGTLIVRKADTQGATLRDGISPADEGWEESTHLDPAEFLPAGELISQSTDTWAKYYELLVQSIRDQIGLPVDASDSLHVLEVLECAVESSRASTPGDCRTVHIRNRSKTYCRGDR